MVDAGHVELLVDVSDHVPESRGALETGGQFPIEVTALGQPPERLGVRGRRSEPQVKAGGGREIDDDLDGLPQVEDDRIRGVGRRPELGGIGGQPRGHPRQVPLDGRRLFGERLAIEAAQRARSSRIPS